MPNKHPGPYQLLKISGEDAGSFLQGQLSNDIYQLDDSWQYSGLCNPKGRLFAILRLWQHEQAFYALVTSDISENIVKRLSMYVLRSKVTLELVEKAAVYCFENQDLLQDFDTELALQREQRDNYLACRIDDNGKPLFALGANHGWLYVCDQSVPAPTDLAELNNHWHDRCIEAGIAEITAATMEAFVPQMVNLDLIGGISFKKGCYTGQEIVARMHYLGNLKQRMLLCSIDGENAAPLKAGQKVYRDAELSKRSGTLVAISQNGKRGLAVLRLADLHDSLRMENGQSLCVTARQPYDVGVASAE